MRKSRVLAEIKSCFQRNGGPPGWNTLKQEGIAEEDVRRHWEYLSDALDEAIGPSWRQKKVEEDIDDDVAEEDPAPKGRRYSVYAIKLEGIVAKDKRFREENPQGGSKGCLYVGQTWHLPELRFKQHKAGYKDGRYVRKHGVRLDLKLTKTEAFATRHEAELAEAEYANELRKRGYQVWQQ